MHAFLPRFLALVVAVCSSVAVAGEEKPPLTAADYQVERMGRWTVQVEHSLDDHPRRAAAVALLRVIQGGVVTASRPG
ncbi:MAG: hypothetical protein EOP87_12840 [Verrucomicrobiaceae bacterium]|nr:MAG: hypothetical protein EOP87_12840 [Verrucomicrobiaceae bacterium]